MRSRQSWRVRAVGKSHETDIDVNRESNPYTFKENTRKTRTALQFSFIPYARAEDKTKKKP